MDTLEAIAKRRSIRKYTGDPIPREDLERIVDAGRPAARGGNRQPWTFIVITEKEMIEKLKRVRETRRPSAGPNRGPSSKYAPSWPVP